MSPHPTGPQSHRKKQCTDRQHVVPAMSLIAEESPGCCVYSGVLSLETYLHYPAKVPRSVFAFSGILAVGDGTFLQHY